MSWKLWVCCVMMKGRQLKVSRKSWVMKLPHGIREQPGWIFIGTMCFLAGLSYLFGVSESAITRELDEEWLRGWGGFLSLAGLLVVISTGTSNRPLERLSLRFLSLGVLVYTGWILATVPLQRVTFVAFMGIALIGLSEIRVAVHKAVLKPLSKSVKEML